MNKEQIEKYINKNLILTLKSGYKYKGKITKTYDNSLEFLDVLNNSFDVDFDQIGFIMGEREVKK